MFGFSTLQLYGIVALVIATVAFGTGWKVRDAFCDAAALRVQAQAYEAKIRALQDNIAQINGTLEADSKRAAEDAAKIEDMEREANELKSKISAGICLPSDDTERLREFFKSR